MSSTDKTTTQQPKAGEASTSTSAPAEDSSAKKLPQLGALEEDDEFEEVNHSTSFTISSDAAAHARAHADAVAVAVGSLKQRVRQPSCDGTVVVQAS